MHSLYFLEGDSYKLLEKKVEEILIGNQFSKEDLVIYDMDEEMVDKAILYLDTYGLFNERKAVWLKNATFLTTNKSEIEQNIDVLTKYINNPNENNILIISCVKADGKKNIVKLLKQKANSIELKQDLHEYIKKQSDGYQISKEAIDYLIEVTGGDFERLNNELDKLLALKKDSKKISNKDIDLVVIKKIDNNIFDLIDAIMSKNKEKSLLIYNNMINYGEDVFHILVAFANQIRLIYQVKVLRNLSNEEIYNLLKLKNIKQVVAIRYKIDKYQTSELLGYLYRLALMDEELKMGKCIDKVVFPMFIASL